MYSKSLYVDGNLTVEGDLKVKRVVDPSNNNFPYLESADSYSNGYLVKFGSTTITGAITKSLLHVAESESVISFDNLAKNIQVLPGTLKLNNDGITWEFE